MLEGDPSSACVVVSVGGGAGTQVASLIIYGKHCVWSQVRCALVMHGRMTWNSRGALYGRRDETNSGDEAHGQGGEQRDGQLADEQTGRIVEAECERGEQVKATSDETSGHFGVPFACRLTGRAGRSSSPADFPRSACCPLSTEVQRSSDFNRSDCALNACALVPDYDGSRCFHPCSPDPLLGLSQRSPPGQTWTRRPWARRPWPGRTWFLNSGSVGHWPVDRGSAEHGPGNHGLCDWAVCVPAYTYS